jgi:hypothetical protein
MTIIKKPGWTFYPAWIFFTVLSIPLAFVLYFIIMHVITYFAGGIIYVNGVRRITEDYLFGYIFVPVTGILTGLLQYGLLRRNLPRMGWWVPATVGGWLLGLILSFGLRQVAANFWTDEVIYGPGSQEVAFFLMGLSIGLGQWLLLRRRLPWAGWWIVANVAGWSLFALVTGQTLGQFGLMVLGLLPASVTAVTLGLLMNQLPPPEAQYV